MASSSLDIANNKAGSSSSSPAGATAANIVPARVSSNGDQQRSTAEVRAGSAGNVGQGARTLVVQEGTEAAAVPGVLVMEESGARRGQRVVAEKWVAFGSSGVGVQMAGLVGAGDLRSSWGRSSVLGATG
jgi:hypothetical protein